MMWGGMNKRAFPRVNYSCRIRVLRDGLEEVIDTFTENIGAGGICVVLDKDLGLFEIVTLEILLGDDSDPIFCDGTVVWVVKRHPVSLTEKTKYDTGVEFRNVPENDKERITRLVENILRSNT